MAAMLRGAIGVEGDVRLLVLFQRLFPGPPRLTQAATPRRPAREEAAMSDGLVKILDGNTFVVSDASGDIEASLTDPTGLFSFDTRFLSKWVLTVNGQRLNPLSVDDLQYFETRFFLVPGTGTVYIDAKLSVIRQRAVGNGFHEELTILNHDDEARRPHDPHRGRLRLRRPLRGQGRAREEGDVLRARRGRAPLLGYQRETFSARRRSRRRLRPRLDESGLTFKVAHRAPRRLDDRPRRRHRAGAGETVRTAEVRARSEAGAAEHGAEPGEVARGGAASSSATGSRSGRRTGAASSISPRCASRRPSPAGGACRPPACRGS